MVNNLIVCSLCQLRFTQVSDKQAHYELNHSLKFLKYCSLCDSYIFFVTDLRKHSKHKSHLVLNPYYSWRQLTSPGLLTGDFNCNFVPEFSIRRRSWIAITRATIVTNFHLLQEENTGSNKR